MTMAADWYPTDGTSAVERSHTGRVHDPIDLELADVLREWSLRDDPREPLGAIILVQFEDGFAARYVGPELISEHELMRRVVYIGDAIREAETSKRSRRPL